MNKNNNSQKSDIEKKIIDEIQKNFRANLDEIGKKCGCSRYKVGRVIKKLEENKAILGYSAIIDPRKINLKYYVMLIKRSNVPLDESFMNKLPLRDITDILPESELKINLKDTSYLHGNFDWMVTFTTDDITYAKEFSNQILSAFYKYVENVELIEMVMPIRINGFKIEESKQIPEILKNQLSG